VSIRKLSRLEIRKLVEVFIRDESGKIVKTSEEEGLKYFQNMATESDAFAEIMCQELLTRNGFTINDSGAEKNTLMHFTLKPIIKQCANEFNSNIRGKLIITAVN
jgi:hypothetical protein